MSMQGGLMLLSVLFYFFLQSASLTYSSEQSSSKPVILLGGLFPVHKNEDNFCGEILDLGVQRLEAMVLATRLINDSPQLLPGVELGFEIRDTCVHPNFALEESLSYVRDRGGHNGTLPGISGVVGAASSGVSIVVANLLRLFSTPQISYASTAKILSDKTRFDYFFRTVPPDSLQARAMAAIIEEFGWTYVHAIYSDDAYGSEGIKAFFDELIGQNRTRICVASRIAIPHGITSPSVFDNAVEELDGEWTGNSSVVVLFGQLSTATDMLRAVRKRDGLEPGFAKRFTWIGSDAWGDQLPVEFHPIARGMISVSPKATVSGEFDEYFTSLNPQSYLANPWFVEYWETFFDCSFNNRSGSQLCDPEQQVISPENGYTQNSKVTFTIDAVFAFAYAIHDMITKRCTGNQLCSEVTDKRSGGVAIRGELLLEYLKKISFPGKSSEKIEFDSSGDEQGDFVIKNLKRTVGTNRFFYDTIGTWSPLTDLNLYGDIEWNGDVNEVPLSACSLPCKGGDFPDPIPGESDCCWQCRPCLGEMLVSTGEACFECEIGFKPDKKKTECIKIVPAFLMWHSPWSIVIVLVTLCGMIATGLISIVIVTCRTHPLIKASSRELSAVMLTGLALCYFLPFLFIAKPSIPICSLRRFGVGVAFAICYSAVLVKANRIFRIFNRAEASLQPPPLISPQSQVLFTGLLVAVQVAISVVWLTVEHPSVSVVYSGFDAELVCGGSPIAGFFVYLGYNFLLLGISCFYGFKSRKIPQTFNETKLINVMLFSTIILWIGLAPAYFATGIFGSIYQTLALILGIILGATIMFAILFLSKMYYLFSDRRKVIKECNEMMNARNNSAQYSPTEHGTNFAANRKKRFSMDLLDVRRGSCANRIGSPSNFLSLTVPKIEIGGGSLCSDISVGLRSHTSLAKEPKAVSDASTQTEASVNFRSATLESVSASKDVNMVPINVVSSNDEVCIQAKDEDKDEGLSNTATSTSSTTPLSFPPHNNASPPLMVPINVVSSNEEVCIPAKDEDKDEGKYFLSNTATSTSSTTPLSFPPHNNASASPPHVPPLSYQLHITLTPPSQPEITHINSSSSPIIVNPLSSPSQSSPSHVNPSSPPLHVNPSSHINPSSSPSHVNHSSSPSHVNPSSSCNPSSPPSHVNCSSYPSHVIPTSPPPHGSPSSSPSHVNPSPSTQPIFPPLFVTPLTSTPHVNTSPLSSPSHISPLAAAVPSSHITPLAAAVPSSHITPLAAAVPSSHITPLTVITLSSSPHTIRHSTAARKVCISTAV